MSASRSITMVPAVVSMTACLPACPERGLRRGVLQVEGAATTAAQLRFVPPLHPSFCSIVPQAVRTSDRTHFIPRLTTPNAFTTRTAFEGGPSIDAVCTTCKMFSFDRDSARTGDWQEDAMRLLLSLVLCAVVMSSPALLAAVPDQHQPSTAGRSADATAARRQRAVGDVQVAGRSHRSQPRHCLRRDQSADEVEPVRHADVDDAGRRLPIRPRVDQHRPGARSDDRHDRPRAAACGGSDRGRSRQRREEPGGALSAHRPAEWHRVAIALGDRGRPANRLRGQERARRCAGDDDGPRAATAARW